MCLPGVLCLCKLQFALGRFGEMHLRYGNGSGEEHGAEITLLPAACLSNVAVRGRRLGKFRWAANEISEEANT